MLPALRPYSDIPANVPAVSVFTVTDTVASPSGTGGATGSEFANSRLANFLSDDAAPRDRDLDTLMSSDNLALYDKGPDEQVTESTSQAEVVPAQPVETAEPISLPPLENLLNIQMEQAEALTQDTMFRGMSSGSFAQEMYTNTQDVLSRIAS